MDGGPVEPGLIERMTGIMAYRGPDGIAHWHGPSAALGHCMMHTTAESLEESQPLTNEDGSLVLVLDGYLTNWEDLRAELLGRGARLRNRSDAELVLRAYEAWGEDCARHIDGEYAFVIWDQRRRRAYCARDHLAMRPLFYHWDGATLVLSSDMAALLAVLPMQPALNHGYMAEALCYRWYSRDETAWAGVLRVLPAHWLSISAKGVETQEYWTLPIEVTITYRRDEDYFEHYRHMLDEAVRRASRSHLPVAFEVSGGLDSSSLFAVADDLIKRGRLPAPDIRGYTLAGPAGDDSDEIEYARAVARHVGRPVAEVPLYLPGLDWFTRQVQVERDFPIYPNGAMHLGIQRQLASDGCRVCVNGVGGDQWLDGTYAYYPELALMGDWRGLRDSVRDDAAHVGAWPAITLAARAIIGPMLPGGVFNALRAARARARAKAWDTTDEGVTPPALEPELARRQARYDAAMPRHSLWSYKLRKLHYPFAMLAHDLGARQNAQAGVDPRSPMFARSFIEFSAATPERTRLRGGVTKYSHRRAMSGLLPDMVANRLTKAGFDITFDAISDELREQWIRCRAELLQCDGKYVRESGNLAAFCNAAIDDMPLWQIWGLYAYAILLGLPQNPILEGPKT